MKVRNLLFMAALLSVGASANADIVDGKRTMPVPAKAELSYTDIMYLYNQGAKKFFCGANAWSTQLSGADQGWQIRVYQYKIGDVAVENEVSIRDNNVAKGDWKTTFLLANGDGYTDRNAQNDTLWTLVPQGNNVYRIQPGTHNPSYTLANNPDAYWGIAADNTEATPVAPWNLTVSDNIDWYFVSLEGYKAITAYYEAETLYEQINKAVEEGVSEPVLAPYRELYKNESATFEELQAGVEGVKSAIAKLAEESITTENPKDMSSFITNASYDNGDNTGWSGTAPTVSTSYHNTEFFNKTYDYCQVLRNLPNGVYALNVQAFYRAGTTAQSYTAAQNGTNGNAKLFAQVGNDTIAASVMNIWSDAAESQIGTGSEVTTDGATGYVPNNMQAAEAYFNAGKYKNSLFFSVSADTTIIGVRKTTTISQDWTIFDNWGLTYYGKGEDAYTMWLKDMLAKVPDYSYLAESDDYYNEEMVNEYNEKREGYTAASSEKEVMDAYNTLSDLSDSIEENLALWKELQSAINDAREKVIDDTNVNGEDAEALGEYVEEVEGNMDDLAYTSDELRTEIVKIKEMTKTAIDNGIAPGADVTDKYLVNADFEVTSGSNVGWTFEGSGGNRMFRDNGSNHVYECWNASNFDVYQEVENAPVGVYTITCNGMFRYLSGNNAGFEAYNNGTAKLYENAVKIYVNDNYTNFSNIYDVKFELTGNGQLFADYGQYKDPDSIHTYPNSYGAAATVFAAGYYPVSTYGVVANSGDKLRVGVKGNTNMGGTSWAIWDNFTMKFEGTNAEIVQPLLEAKKQEVSDSLASTVRTVGSEIATAANGHITAADDAISAGEGKDMFDALVALIGDLNDMDASAAAFDSLSTANDNLNADLSNYDETASEAALNAGANLCEEVAEKLAAKSLTTAEAREYIAKIQAADAALRIPKGTETATEENPVDMTSAIQTPNYDDGNGGNSIAGWVDEKGNKNFGNDADQKQALLLEYYNNYFNHYQKLTSLPAGYYKVQVSAFYRYGSTAEDYAHYLAGDTNDKVYMYAVAADTVKTNLTLLGAGALTEDPGYSGQATTSGVYLPNSMQSANSWFTELGAYVNTLTAQVGDDGVLTIGIRKNTKVGYDWVIFDSWKLYYLGTKTPSGIQGITTADDAAGAIQEIYTLGGARVNSLQKGVNIVKTKNGAVKKVVVK